MTKERQSILYIWLPCKRIFPLGPSSLANYVHLKRPHIRQKILDLSLIDKQNRLKTVFDEISSFNPDIIAFSWRDIQIYAPHEGDRSLELAFDFYYSSSIIRKIKAGLSGLSMVFTYENSIRDKINLLQKTCNEFPEKTVLVGGGALSVFSEEIMKRLPEGIIGIIGEGEDAILAIIDGTDILKHRVIFKENGKLKSGIQAKPLSIQDIFMDYEYIASIFPEISVYYQDTIGIQTKRGCPFQCEFCLYPYIEGGDVRYRDTDQILKEIDFLYSKWNVRKFWFADAQFIPGSAAIPHCTALLEGIVKKGLPIEWSGYVRTSLITPELAKLMVRSGVGDLEISITSGSQKVLNEMSMGFRLDNLYEGCRYLKKEGYRGQVILNYSINAPGETEETIMESVNSYRKIVNIMGKDQVKPVIFFIGVQPHTKLEGRLMESGYLEESYNPLALDPFSIKKLLYNPPPLDKIIARSCLEAWDKNLENSGEQIMDCLEKRLSVEKGRKLC